MTKGYDEKRTPEQIAEEKARHESLKKKLKIGGTAAVSYTHLTLPTNSYV